MTILVRPLLLAATAAGLAATPSAAQTTQEQAVAIIAPFYEAFNPAPGKDAAALLRRVTAENWESCSGNKTCAPRDAVIGGIIGFGQAIPNLT
jgi:hypothetical protein